MRTLFGFKLNLSKDEPKEDPKFYYRMSDIEKEVRETLERLEGIKIENEDDRIKNFFNGKFLRGMKKELGQMERNVNELTASQKKIIESLDSYMEGIKKKFEERIDTMKMALFQSLLQKSMEANEHLSDLTLSSQKLNKKLHEIEAELRNNGCVIKTSVPAMLDMFEQYKKNLIKIKEEDLADGVTERICSRMDEQTRICTIQLDKLIESCLSPNQILTFEKQEIVNVNVLNMLDLDDTRSTWSRDDEEFRHHDYSQIYGAKHLIS